MLLTNLFGVTASSSSRVHVTAEAGSALMFLEMKTRPVVVAAQPVDASAVDRSIAETAGPALSPHAASVRRTAPSSAQSPQTTVKSPVQVLQCCWASSI